jgi:hypothetical protein
MESTGQFKYSHSTNCISFGCYFDTSEWNQQGNSRTSLKHFADDMKSPMSLPAPKQLKFSPGIVNGSVRELATYLDQTRKVIPPSHAAFWVLNLLFDLAEMFVAVAGTYRTIVNEETSSCRTSWETLEVEEKSSSVATTVQMEVAKALETLRMDQAQ